jgi:hypothetical protein
MTGTCLVGLKCLSMTLLIFCFHRHSVGLARCKRIWKRAKLLMRVYYRVGTFAKHADHVASVLQPFRYQAKIRFNGCKGFGLNCPILWYIKCMTSNQNIEQVISRAVTFATTGLICYTSTASCYPSRNVVANCDIWSCIEINRNWSVTSQRGVYCVPKKTSMSRRVSQIAPTFSSTHGQSEMAIPQRFYSIVMNSSTHYICTCRTSLLTLPMPPIRSNITHAPSPCTKTLPVGDSAPPLHTLRSSSPYEDSEGDSSPPLQTIVQFAKLPHDSLNDDWHLGTTAYRGLCRSFAFTDIL